MSPSIEVIEVCMLGSAIHKCFGNFHTDSDVTFAGTVLAVESVLTVRAVRVVGGAVGAKDVLAHWNENQSKQLSPTTVTIQRAKSVCTLATGVQHRYPPVPQMPFAAKPTFVLKTYEVCSQISYLAWSVASEQNC